MGVKSTLTPSRIQTYYSATLYFILKGEKMAILRDKEEQGTYIEFSFLSCIPGKNEGCRLNFKHYKENKKFYELNFGWTNQSIDNYIQVTANFPLEMLDNFILNNLHMSYENHLHGLEWTELDEDHTFSLHFFGAQQDFTLTAIDDEIRQFGREFESEWKKGMRLAELAEQ